MRLPVVPGTRAFGLAFTTVPPTGTPSLRDAPSGVRDESRVLAGRCSVRPIVEAR